MALRADLQQIIDDIDAADRAVDALVTPLTDAQFHQAPETGGWSVGQCLDHLAATNLLYSGPLRNAIDSARQKKLTGGGPIASSFFGLKFIASQEPPIKRKFSAPAKVQPRSTGTRAEIVQAYRASHETIREIVRTCADVDVNRAKFPNPFVPLFRVRVGTGLRVLTAHERRHLWQAEQVRNAVVSRR